MAPQTPLLSRFPIIDSHIHLYPASEIDTLAWYSPGSPLDGQKSLEEYTKATSSAPELEGFIFLETDRKHDLEKGIEDGSGWEMPLKEVEWLERIASGRPKPGEGHSEEHKKLCLAIIPWAPLPSGAEAMEKYVEMVSERAESSFGKIRGFRYLVQDKPKGVMLGDGFVEGLKWLGKKGYTFDLGIDQRSGGDWQFEEAIEMITRAHEGVDEQDKVTVIINHLCKPNLHAAIMDPDDLENTHEYNIWRNNIFALSRLSKTYMKLSGCFSELPAKMQTASVPAILTHIQPWLIVILATFKTSRIMFGSDWPVCTVGVGDDAWQKWTDVVQMLCGVAGLTKEEQIMLWSGTAIKAYNIEELMSYD